MTAPRRRWSFGLRTLFVVVTVLGVPLGWLACNLNWMRERHELVAEIRRRGEPGKAWVMLADDPVVEYCGPPKPPFPLGIFGEVAIAFVEAAELSPEEAARARNLFPEAIISYGSSPTVFPVPEDSPAAQDDRH